MQTTVKVLHLTSLDLFGMGLPWQELASKSTETDKPKGFRSTLASVGSLSRKGVSVLKSATSKSAAAEGLSSLRLTQQSKQSRHMQLSPQYSELLGRMGEKAPQDHPTKNEVWFAATLLAYLCHVEVVLFLVSDSLGAYHSNNNHHSAAAQQIDFEENCTLR
eukprot:4523055-Amphidinium_carterae.1